MSRFCLMCQQREALAMPSTTILKLSGYTKTDCAIPVIGKGGFAVVVVQHRVWRQGV